MTTTNKSRRLKTDLELAQEKREAAMAKLEQGIQSLLDSGRWQQWLTMMSRLKSLSMNRYSWQNCLLVLMQNPDATVVAGYRDWQKAGRQVRKGEKGIAIRAPFTKKTGELDEEGKEKKSTYFNLVTVFDISQTDGEELPQLVSPLHGDDAGLYAALIRACSQLQVPVFEESMDSRNGYCKFDRIGDRVEKIVISNNLEPLHKAKTLAHELFHALVHKGENYAQHRELMEIEAESGAFIVLNYFGLDSSNFSIGYVTGWGNGIDAIARLKESATCIQTHSERIINMLEQQRSLVN